MKRLTDYINEEITITGALIRPSSTENYVRLFFSMLSQVSKAYKKESNPNNYTIEGCGRIYASDVKTKTNGTRIYYTLLDEIVTNRSKIYYTLQLDIDSQNVLIQYKEYKNKDMRNQYLAIMLAKKHIMENLKKAGFTVKSDRGYIYATSKNYIREPGELVINGETKNIGNICMNGYQQAVYDVAKKLFTFEGDFPGFNKYAIKLTNAKAKDVIKSGDKTAELPAMTEFEKIIVVSNGMIKAFFSGSKAADIVLYQAFAPVSPKGE